MNKVKFYNQIKMAEVGKPQRRIRRERNPEPIKVPAPVTVPDRVPEPVKK